MCPFKLGNFDLMNGSQPINEWCMSNWWSAPVACYRMAHVYDDSVVVGALGVKNGNTSWP